LLLARQNKEKMFFSSVALLFREYCKAEFARTLGVIFDPFRNFKQQHLILESNVLSVAGGANQTIYVDK
jgi:hypothetical protein